MAKSKSKDSKAVASTPLGLKNGGVTKPAQAPKAKSKELAKSAAKKAVKDKDLKKQKAKEPEPSDDSSVDSESESDEDSDSDSSESDSSESEAEKPVAKKAATNGKSKKAAADSDSSDSDSDSDSDEEMANGNGAKLNGHANGAADSSDSDSDSESDDETPAQKVNGQAKDAASSDDSDSEDDSDSDSSDSDDEDEPKEAEAPSKKRKAEEEVSDTPKKAKTEAATTLFAGSLSWGVDDNALYEAFKDFEGLTNARVVTDKNSGRSRGFGYVDFADAESATKAYEAMQGQEVDGRALNLDYANAKPADANPRDRAADRAQKHGDSLSPPSDTLFVGNLPFDVDQDSVREFFGEVCEVASVRLPTDPDSGNLKGFGYVSFNSIEDAKTVLEQMNGAPIGNGRMSRSVRLDYASSRPNRDGGGGGFGGRGGGRGGFGGRGGRGGGGFGGRGGGDRGRGGRGGGRGGFGGSRGGSNFSGTKMTFD